MHYPIHIPAAALEEFSSRGWDAPQITGDDYRQYWMLLHNYLEFGEWGDSRWGNRPVRMDADADIPWRPGPEPQWEFLKPPEE